MENFACLHDFSLFSAGRPSDVFLDVNSIKTQRSTAIIILVPMT